MSSTAPVADFDYIQRDALRLNLQKELLEQIPMAAAMQLAIAQWDGERVELHAPLAPNVNDKGCAFGGSLVSVMTLACWSLIKLAADQRGFACEIYVQDSTVRYLAPVWDDFRAFAQVADGQSLIATRCSIALADGTAACTLEARFVALRSKLAADPAQSTPAPDPARR